DPLPAAGDEVLSVGFDIGFSLHLLDIGSRREGPLIAGEHDRADRRIAFELVKGGAELLDQPRVQRIERRRPIEPDQTDRALPLNEDGLFMRIAHASLPLTLALGAEECRAAGLDDTAHPLGTGTARARLALLAVNRPAMLEIAEFAVGLDIVAQRRAAGLDRLAQH